MANPNGVRGRAGLRPVPGDKDLFVYVNLSRDPVKEKRLLEEIHRDVEELEKQDRAKKAIP